MRWLFNTAAAGSLVLCVATVVMCVRSYYVRDQLSYKPVLDERRMFAEDLEQEREWYAHATPKEKEMAKEIGPWFRPKLKPRKVWQIASVEGRIVVYDRLRAFANLLKDEWPDGWAYRIKPNLSDYDP